MCTVTLTPYLKSTNGFILTSNRDETGEREAIPPQFYDDRGVKILYPKDKLAGGSWIGISSRNRLICLLNGGFEDHQRNPPYRQSRGVVVKDLLVARELVGAINNYDFQNIEPFTIIAADWKEALNFIEFVWDGERKHVRHLDHISHLWSSSPLYSSEVKKLREDWFAEFQKKKPISAEGIWEFHHSAGTGDKDTDVIMDRGFIKTQSITQVIYDGKEVKMIYEELKTGNIVETNFKL